MIWDRQAGEFIKKPKEMITFLEDIKQVCLKYNMSIAHEDYNGAFIIEKYRDENIEWLCEAFKNY